MNKTLILLCGGSGSRMQAGINKVFISLSGRPVLLRSLDAFSNIADQIVVVYRSEDEHQIRDLVLSAYPDRHFSFVCGGASRQESVMNGLKTLPDSDGIVMIHDAARCLVNSETILEAVHSAEIYGSGIPAVPLSDTIKKSTDHKTIDETIDRSLLYAVQTPQCFMQNLIYEAYRIAEKKGFIATDDASVMELTGNRVHLTKGHKHNLKLTTPEDIAMAEHIVSDSTYPMIRIGHGYDVHRLVKDRNLILCGVDIPHTLGLLGHSDADVALHALMDAMLGALALGDIGHLFPDHDSQYSGISSRILLREVNDYVRSKGYSMGNCDITIAAQKPKLAPYINQMRQNIAEDLGCSPDCVSVKATTTEKLGFEGAEEGISAQAVCLLYK